MNKPEQWFLDRIGEDVLRDGKPWPIKNERYAKHHYSLQSYFTYTAPVRVHSGPPESTCTACEG